MKKIFSFVIVAFAAIALNAKEVVMHFDDATTLASYGITVPKAGEGTNLSKTPFTVDGVTFSCEKKNAKTDTRIWNSDGKYTLRTYVDNTITLTSEGDNIKGIDVVGTAPFAELTNGSWSGDAKSVTLTATGTAQITQITIYLGEAPVITIDTLNVAEMIALIDAAPNKKLSKKAYVIGRVGGIYNGIAQYGSLNVWLGDIRSEYAKDTIEAYGMLNYNGVKYNDAEEIQFGMGDTIVVYSSSWEYFSDDKNQQYEASKGCFLAEVIGEGHPKPIVIEEISVEEAVKIAQGLTPESGKSAKTTVKYDVRAYVVGAHEEKENVWFLADDPEAERGELQAYQCTLADGSAPVEVGAFVSVIGYISNYNGGKYNSYEISKGKIAVITETALPTVIANKVSCKKMMINGQMYIKKDNKLYSVLGQTLQ